MPTYEFKCNKCGHQFEVFTSIRLRRKTKCPKCKSPNITQILSSFYTNGSSSCESCKATTCNTCSFSKEK
ncbi:zinc ribbon domain-containing protein [candidate division WOR-3 bacterium]|nr:zinc ribbon domain-containing protein [candidate division WOR-3 bacterium]